MKNKFGIETQAEERSVKVTNLLTQESEEYYNNDTLSECLISHIMIIIKHNTCGLLIPEQRDKIRTEAKITETTSKTTGRRFAYSEAFDLHATDKK